MKLTKKLSLLLISIFGTNSLMVAQFNSFDFGRKITIDVNQVNGATDHLEFPVFFHFTDALLKSTGNGGNVASSNATDLIFTDANCNDQLDHEIVKYDPITGELAAWVKIPTLSISTDTEIFMLYGDSSAINTETTAVWSNGFSNVYHFDQLKDTTDVSGNGFSASNQGTIMDTSSKILDGRYFDGQTDYIEVSTSGMSLTQGTVSCWVKPDNLSGTNNEAQYIFGHTTQPAWDNRIQVYANHPSSTGELNLGFGDSHTTALNVNTLVDGNWSYVTLTWGKEHVQTAQMYVDGQLVSSDTVSTLLTYHPVADIGNNGEVGSSGNSRLRSFNGIIDEFQISDVRRSQSWIATSFNNQDNPGSFSQLSTEYSYNDLCDMQNTIEELDNQLLFSIYPNPNKGELYIRHKDRGLGTITISLTNIIGQETPLSNKSITTLQGDTRIDLENVPDGIYLLTLTFNDRSESHQVIVSK